MHQLNIKVGEIDNSFSSSFKQLYGNINLQQAQLETRLNINVKVKHIK